MRSIAVLIGGAAILAACSRFSGADSPSTPLPTDDGSAPDGDAGEGGVITGEPADDSFVLEPISGTATIIQGSDATVPITIKRGKNLHGPVMVTLSGAPAGITAAPLAIDDTTGNLMVSGTMAAQGNATAMVVATIDQQVLMTPLTMFVRGAPGALDTTWGTNGQVIASDTAKGLKSEDLILGPNDDVYALFSEQSSGVNNGAVHLDAAGAIDTTFNGGYANIFQLGSNSRAEALDAAGRLVVVGGLAGACRERLKTDGTQDFAQCGGVGGSLGGTSNGVWTLAVRDDNHFFYSFDNQNGSEVDCATVHYDDTGAIVTSFGQGGAVRDTASVPIGLLVGSGAGAPLTVMSVGADLVYFTQFNSDTAAVVTAPKSVLIPGVARPAVGAQGVVQLTDGSIVAPFNGSSGLYLLKLGSTGDPVAGFGTGGLQGPFTVGGSGLATGIAVQMDGKFLVVLDNGGLVRFTSAGVVDTAFGNGGIASTTVGDLIHRRVVVQKTTGRLLVSGEGTSAIQAVVRSYWP